MGTIALLLRVGRGCGRRARRAARWGGVQLRAAAAPARAGLARALAASWPHLRDRLRRAGEKVLYLVTCEMRGRPARRSLWAGTPILTLPVKAKAERLLGVHADTL